MIGLLQGISGPNFGNGIIPLAHPLLCAFQADRKGNGTAYMYRYVIYVPLLNTILTPHNDGKPPTNHSWCLGKNAHQALARETRSTSTSYLGEKFPR